MYILIVGEFGDGTAGGKGENIFKGLGARIERPGYVGTDEERSTVCEGPMRTTIIREGEQDREKYKGYLRRNDHQRIEEPSDAVAVLSKPGRTLPSADMRVCGVRDAHIKIEL